MFGYCKEPERAHPNFNWTSRTYNTPPRVRSKVLQTQTDITLIWTANSSITNCTYMLYNGTILLTNPTTKSLMVPSILEVRWAAPGLFQHRHVPQVDGGTNPIKHCGDAEHHAPAAQASLNKRRKDVFLQGMAFVVLWRESMIEFLYNISIEFL